MVTPNNQDQDQDRSKTQPVEPDEILDKDSGTVTPFKRSQGVSSSDESLFNETMNWVRDIFDATNRKMRTYFLAPIVVFGSLYVTAEVTGINEILWGLLAALFARTVVIVWSWPAVLTLMALNRYSAKIIGFFIVEFVFELALIIIGLLTPIHTLDDVAWRFLPSLCIIGVLAIVLKESLDRRTLPRDTLVYVKVGFVIGIFIAVFALADRLFGWEILY